MEQHGGHRGVHAARKAQHHPVVAQLRAQIAHGRFDEALRRPRLRASADADHEVPEQLRAVGRVVDLGMELDAPRPLALHAEGGHADILRSGDEPVGNRHGGDRIPVRHPDLRGAGQAMHQRVLRIAHRQHRTAVLAARRRVHLAAESVGEVLCAVADAQQRKPPLDGRQIGIRGMLVPHRIGTAREDHPPHRSVYGRYLVEGVDLAIDVQLAHTPRDELRVLRTEVENQDFFHICYIQYLVFDRRLHASACTGNSGPEFSPVRPCTEICAQRVRRCLRRVGSSAVRRSLRCISARCCSWGPRA